MPDDYSLKNNWHVLTLITITGTFVAAIPFSCMPVLFQEISQELNLDLVEIGMIWGIPALAGIFVSILSGVLSDKFGVKTILVVFCILTGITGALRGLSVDFFSLAVTVFLNGVVRLVIPVTVTKTLALYFKGPRLGLAQGIGAAGMGLGLLLGPLISATVLSPALGGWRNVMYFYGGLSTLTGILWLLMGKKPLERQAANVTPAGVPLRQALGKLLRLKPLWLLGLTMMFRSGGLMGMTGYLPLYLYGKGWSQAAADGALSLFYAMSTFSVIPLSFLSDRLGSRKAIILPSLLVNLVCISVLPVAPGNLVWGLMVLSGMFMDAYMAITVTMLMETRGVGIEYAGTALGIMFSIAQIGGLVAPPLGNAFAHINPGLPFAFWAVLTAAAVGTFFFVKETGWRKGRTIKAGLSDF